MKSTILKGVTSLFLSYTLFTANAQNAVGIGTDTPNPRAVLELISPTNDQGFLVPRLTTAQRTAGSFTSSLSATENGLMVYDSDLNEFYYWINPGWVAVNSSTLSAGEGISIDSIGQITNIGDLDSLNEIQDLDLTGNDLSITNNSGATTIDLTQYQDLTTHTGNLPAGQVSGLGSAALLDAGTNPNELVQLDAGGALPALDGSQLTGVSALVSADAVGGAEIQDGSIADVDISGTAAISGLKINPDFGTQNVLTSGTITASSFTGDGSALTGVTGTPGLNSVGTNEIIDLSITNADISNGTISTLKINGLPSPNSLLYSNGTGTSGWFTPGIDQVVVTDPGGGLSAIPVSSFVTSNLTQGSIFIGDGVDQSSELPINNDGFMLIGNGITANSVDISGDIDIANTGISTIQIGAVGDAEISDVDPSKLLPAGAISGDVLEYDGSSWIPGTDDDNQNAAGVPYTDTYLVGAGDVQGGLDYAINELTNNSFNSNQEVPRGNGSTLVSSNIFSDGTNVSVGGAPTDKFTVEDVDARLRFSEGATNSALLIGATTTKNAAVTVDASDGDGVGLDYGQLIQFDDLSVMLQNTGANPLDFATNGSTRMTIDAVGDISMSGGLNVSGIIGGDGSNLTNVTPSFATLFAEDPSTIVFGSTSIVPTPPSVAQSLQVVADNVGGGALVAAGTFSADPSTNRSTVTLLSGRGSQLSPQPLQQNDLVGELVFNGYFGTNQTDVDNAASVEALASQNWTTGATGGELFFSTTTNNTSGATERMRISHDGNVGIGTSTPLSSLQLNNAGHFMHDGTDLIISDNIHLVGPTPTYTETDAGMTLSLSSNGGFDVYHVTSGTAGTDASLNFVSLLSLNTSGSGGIPGDWQAQNITVAGDLVNAKELRFGDANNSEILAFKAPDDVGPGNSVIWTLPDGDGLAGQVLFTDGAGSLGWSTIGAGGGSAVVLGASAGENNTGNFNVFLGNVAGQSNTTGQNNTFVGYNAGNANIGDGANTYIGSQSGSGSTNINNTFVGYLSGANNSGANNTMMGHSAGGLSLDVSGNGNTFIGSSAGADNTTAGFNTYVGANAGRDNDTGSNNTYLGQNAGIINVGGLGNTLIGAQAGSSLTSGDNNVFIGQNTAATRTSSTGNVLIGQEATLGSDGLNNSVAIGSNASVDISNAIVLGTGATNVGIGTSSPAVKLDVNGDIAASNISSTGTSIFVGPSTGTAGTSNTFVGYQSGLSVTSGGSNTLLGGSAGQNITSGAFNTVLGTSAGTNLGANNGNTLLGYDTEAGGAIINSVAIGYQAQVNLSNAIVLGRTGVNTPNVGIGTDAPTTYLHVTSGSATNAFPEILVGDVNTSNNSDASIGFRSQDGVSVTTNFVAGIDGDTRDFVISEGVTLGTTDAMIIESGTRNIGIGIAPGEKLDVLGNIQVDGASEFRYASPKVRYQSFPASVFKYVVIGDGALTGGFRASTSALNFHYFNQDLGVQGFADVPVNLPQDAEVTDLDAWVWDNDGVNPVRVELVRQPFGSPGIAPLLTAETSITSASVEQITDIGSVIIDNINESYFLRFTGFQDNSQNTRLYNVRITYTVLQAD